MKNRFIAFMLMLLISCSCFAQSTKKISRKERKKIEKIEQFEILKKSLSDTIFSFKPKHKTTDTGQRSRGRGYMTLDGSKGTVELPSKHEDDLRLYLETGFNPINYRYKQIDQGQTLLITYSLKYRGVIFKFEIKSTVDGTIVKRNSSDRGQTIYEGKLVAK